VHAAVAALVAALGVRAASPGDALEQQRAAIAKEVVQLGAELQRRIEAGDAEALVARVPADGLRCAGTIVPREKVARDLRGPERWLHRVFFGAPGTKQRPDAAPSLAAFLRSADEVAIVVSFQRDARAGPAGRPCIDYRVKDRATPGAPLCFEKRDGRWWFTESLYPCGG
jgi:hypothetical protein